MRRPAVCEKCGCEVRIVKRAFGLRGWLVLDPEPSIYGNVALDDHERGMILGALDVLKDKDNTERFEQHYRSCAGRRGGRAAA